MAVAGNNHYPCIIYLREQGNPIGKIENINLIRQQRMEWIKNHNTHENEICKNNCIDVCVDYNNKWEMLHTDGLKSEKQKDTHVKEQQGKEQITTQEKGYGTQQT